jgi:hypothetical protein
MPPSDNERRVLQTQMEGYQLLNHLEDFYNDIASVFFFKDETEPSMQARIRFRTYQGEESFLHVPLKIRM